MQLRKILIFTAFLAAMVLCASDAALAADVAYWRFEEGPAAAQTPVQPTYGVLDSTGNGNNMTGWALNWANAQYKLQVELPVVPQTSATDTFCTKNVGGYPALFTNSSVTAPSGTDVEAWQPLTWSVEASYKPEDTSWYRTVVGRDGYGVCTADATQAVFYLSICPDDSVAARYVDVSGVQHSAQSAAEVCGGGFINSSDPEGLLGKWYNLAATCDGSVLSVYVDNALVASTTFTSTDARMTNGLNGSAGGGDWHAGGWSVYRGMWNHGHCDRAYGFIDEVRITDTCLPPEDFLYAPEPATLTMLAIAGAFGFVYYRRIRKK